MICSLNEVGATLRKASVGAGFATGLAAASAAAGVWLCAHGLDGVGAVVAATIRATEEPDVTVNAETQTVTIGRASVGRCGASVFDLLRTDAVERVIVEAPDSPLLLIGFAGTAAHASGTSFALADGSGASIHVAAGAWSGSTELSADGWIEVASSAWISSEANPPPHGVHVDETMWNQALELAQRTYVPSSDESRIRGAGAGLTDND